MGDLFEFFKREGIIFDHRILKYKDRRKGCKISTKEYHIPKQTPQIIRDIYDIVKFLYRNGLHVKQIEKPVLATIVQHHTGYSKKWSYIIASALIELCVLFD